MKLFSPSFIIFIWILFSIVQLMLFLSIPDSLVAISFGFGIGMVLGSIEYYFLNYLFEKSMILNRTSEKLIELQKIKIARLQGNLI